MNTASPQPDPQKLPPLTRDPVQFRFKSHVHEYICPGSIEKIEGPSVFVGGGITNCPDWQADFAELLNSKLAAARSTSSTPSILMNPRRSHFPIGDPDASPFQIRWEHEHLKRCGAISLWFPKDSEGPISLFETGRWLKSSKPLYIGIEPGYRRATELRMTIDLLRPGLQVAETLEAHAQNVADWVMGMGKLAMPRAETSRLPSSVYLAGGITNCPDWQAEATTLLTGSGIIPINPRRDDFKGRTSETFASDVARARAQLDASEAVLLWFPAQHITPVALLELGTLISTSRPLFVGVEEGYLRAIDVRIQCELERPEMQIAQSLPTLIAQVLGYYKRLTR